MRRGTMILVIRLAGIGGMPDMLGTITLDRGSMLSKSLRKAGLGG